MTDSTPTDAADLAHAAADCSERLSADDLASRLDAQGLASALARQRDAAAALHHKPGTCASCDAKCLPLAVYCDDECRAEHERRQAILRRQGRA